MNRLNPRPVINWLFIGVFLILVMVGVGGSVRLTNAGLSIVDWKPITGIIPPLNETEWQFEFDKYKKIPEYKAEHQHFELNDFKTIFLWEYFHRLAARLVGFIFIIPFGFFWFKGYFKDRKLLTRVVLIFFFAAFQAWLGWYMVTSGFEELIDVSHMRLAIHLFVATLLASFVLWTALDLKYQNRRISENRTFKKWSLGVLFLLSIQLFYGAFTAGLNAGYYYPQYPKMGSTWFPNLAIQAFKNTGLLSLMEDPSMVHFIHRWFAMVVVTVILIFYFKFIKKAVIREEKLTMKFVLALVVTQFSLGIITVLTRVNIFIAVSHQVVGIVLFLGMVALLFFSMGKKNS